MPDSPYPRFRFDRYLLDHDRLRYNPTNEWIFPSPIATDRLERPLAAHYMYYSPHECPGGVCLALADHPLGPWREYPGNPIISRTWPPHYTVSHVASPHPLWMEDEGRLFLWFHGENDVTRYASSSDGVHFDYEGVALRTSDFDDDLTECSYARVFPDPCGDGYVFLAMGNRVGTRHIYLARSRDGRAWTPHPGPLLSPPHDLAGGQVSAPFLHRHAGQWFLLHHCDVLTHGFRVLRGHLRATPVATTLEPVGEGVEVYDPTTSGPDFTRAGDPYPIVIDGELRLVYTSGRRLEGRIALLRGE
jgi:hypothetical protein